MYIPIWLITIVIIIYLYKQFKESNEKPKQPPVSEDPFDDVKHLLTKKELQECRREYNHSIVISNSGFNEEEYEDLVAYYDSPNIKPHSENKPLDLNTLKDPD